MIVEAELSERGSMLVTVAKMVLNKTTVLKDVKIARERACKKEQVD